MLLILFTYSQSKAQEFKPTLNLSTAQEIVKGSLAYAKSNNLNIAIAIFDSYGQLISFVKMDGASIGTAQVAQWKGLSASIYKFSTEETAKWNVPNAPNIATVPGGVLIKDRSDNIIGSIGVSGADAATDVKCAEAGLVQLK